MSKATEVIEVRTCMNCEHCEWEVWAPTIKVRCRKGTTDVSYDTTCILHKPTKKTTWKDKWMYTEQYHGHPYEEI